MEVAFLKALDGPHLPTPDRCPNCGFEGTMQHVERDELVEGCGNVVKMRVDADVCSHCGEPVYDLRTIGEMQAMERRLCSGETTGLIPTGVAYREPLRRHSMLMWMGVLFVKASVQRVADALAQLGIQAEITEFSESTRTAEEAAAAVNSTVGQIVKSLVFMAGERPVLAMVSGANRVDTGKLAEVAGGPISRPNADAVRAATGFSIGGVPPVGHATPLATYLDRDLLQYERVWAAAGTPNAVFPIAPDDLQRITGATVADLAAR